MGSFRRSFLLAVMMTVFAGAPTEAQQPSTLTVTARVVESCVITSKRKRELARILRETGRSGLDPEFVQRCSRGVVSRVNAQMVNQPVLQPLRQPAPRIDKRLLARAARAGSEVMMTTVTY